jgi:hypothetical protein
VAGAPGGGGGGRERLLACVLGGELRTGGGRGSHVARAEGGGCTGGDARETTDGRRTKTGLWDGRCRLRECRTRRGRMAERKKKDYYCSLNK